MKSATLFILSAIGIFIIAIVQASKSLTYAAGKLANFSVKGGVVSWTQGIIITNGSNVPIPINSVNIRNFINGQEIGSTILQGMQLIRSGKNELIFTVTIPYTDLLNVGLGIYSVIKTGKFNMRFLGTLNSFFLPINVDQSIIVDFKKTLNF
jgi:hypothetical protein